MPPPIGVHWKLNGPSSNRTACDRLMSELKMLSLQAVEVEVVSAEELQLPLCWWA